MRPLKHAPEKMDPREIFVTVQAAADAASVPTTEIRAAVNSGELQSLWAVPTTNANEAKPRRIYRLADVLKLRRNGTRQADVSERSR